MVLLKGCTQYVSKFGKPSSGHQTGKGKSSSQFQRRSVLKNVRTTGQLCSLSLLVSLCSKSFKVGFSSTWIENFQMYRLVLEKAEEPEIKLPFTVNLCFPGTPWNLRHWQLILHEVILVEMSLIDNAWKFLSSIKFTFGWGLYWLKEKKK